MTEARPDLTEDGTIDVKRGQWVYVFCDVSEEGSKEQYTSVLSLSWMDDYI